MLGPVQAVANGVALLDRAIGPDWDEAINLDTLNISSGLNCICGQLFGSYSKGATMLQRYGYDGVTPHGFGEDMSYGSLLACGIFTEEWKRVIKARRYERACREVERDQQDLEAQVRALEMATPA